MATLTVFDAYSAYLEVAASNVKPMLNSLFVRFLSPAWGGKAPEGVRATPFEIIAVQEHLKKVSVSKLVGSKEELEIAFEKSGVTKPNRKPFRSIYKAFLEWAERNNYFSVQASELTTNEKRSVFSKKRKRKHNYHGRIHKDPYALTALTSQTKELIYKNDYVNENLENEIKKFKKFRHDRGISHNTIDKDTSRIYQILGWLHRYKNIRLEDLSLENIISYQKLSVSLNDCKDFNDLFLKKAINRQAALDISKENKKNIEEYLDFIDGNPRSKIIVVTVCINIAKFIFQNEIDDDEYIDDSDFPIVRRLNQLSNKLSEKARRTPATVPHSSKSVPWEYVYPLLDKLREKFSTKNYTVTRKNGKTCSLKRKKTAIFNDLQYFLSLAFMTLMPPDRSRTFYELEIGRTLVKGILENDIFTPEDKLKDKSATKWYIHLESDGYKTGKIYGEFWGEIPNYQFNDGALFYDYIEMWINEGRNCGRNCTHNFFFRGTDNYQKLTSEGWKDRIINMFYQEVGVPVTPKELRKMYVSYLKDQGVSEAELEGAAWWMKHSRMMQSKIYDQQNKTNKMAPIQEFNRRKFEEYQNRA